MLILDSGIFLVITRNRITRVDVPGREVPRTCSDDEQAMAQKCC